MKTRESTLKQILIALLSGILVLTACGQTPAEDIPIALISTETNTVQPITSTPLPTRTPRERANEPTRTPRPPTPLPTIPTFTPTFDVSTIVTVGPAQPAICPTEDPEIMADFSGPYIYGYDEVLTYLNSGGSSVQLAEVFSNRDPDASWGKIIDLTGDGVSEIAYRTMVQYDILGCRDGKYQSLFNFGGDFAVTLGDTPDLNKNGIPEMILFNIIHYGYVDISIFEWDGNKFRSLINLGSYGPSDPPIDWASFNEGYQVIDTNGDGLKEIVVVYNVHQQAKGVFGGYDIAMQRPLRDQTIILGWNGQNFVNIKQGTNTPPQYRFQAIQDGDEQIRYGNYTAALSFYQAAIFDDRLEWWSSERREYEIHIHMSQFDATPTVYPTPNPDITEYPRLAAYAYYRIMLIHIVQGHESDAGTVYKTLGQKFGNNPYGYPYFEIATVFWEAYQSTHKMYDGCAAAIEYAAEHPEILISLGSDYHGGYSHTYVPADVCPFR
jgi:hypothetical protein